MANRMTIRHHAIRRLLYCWLFFSGFAGLVYELVWMRFLRLVMGNATVSVAATLAIYMAGLAIGSYLAGRWIDKRNRPVLIYGVLQALLAVCALLVPWLISGARPIFGWIHANVPAGSAQLALRLIVCTFVLIVPASLIGATFPAVASYFSTKDSRFDPRIGKLYAINSIGAAVGTLVTGFIFLPKLGLRGTNYLGIAINFLIFVSIVYAMKFSESPRAGNESEKHTARIEPARNILQSTESTESKTFHIVLCLAAIFTSGLTSMLFEVTWTRVLTLTIGSSVYAFAMILAAFIAGLGLGSFFSARVVAKWRMVLPILAITQILIGLTTLIVTYVLGRLPVFSAGIFTRFHDSIGTILGIEFAIVFAVVIVPTFLLGAMFPMALHIYAYRIRKPGKASGTVSAINTTGAIIGSLVAVFVLIPLAGTFVATIAGSLINVSIGVACLAVLAASGNRWRRLIFAGIAVVLSVLGVLGMPDWNSAVLSSGPYLYAGNYNAFAQKADLSMEDAMTSQGRILYYKEGLSATVSVHAFDDGSLSLKINGKTDASTHGDEGTELFAALLPILLHRDPETALVVGLGSGITLGSLERYPFAKIDCVEISPAVVEAAGFFSEQNRNALDDSRLSLILADGRHWVTFTEQTYDIITSEPSNPWIAGIGDLFTEEFFELASQRLNDGGIMMQWLQAYSMSEADFKTVVNTFASVFPYAAVWEASLGKDYLLVGSKAKQYSDARRITDKISRDDLREDMRTIGVFDIPSLFSRLVIDDVSVREFVEGAEINTDNNVRLEFSAPLNLYRNDLQLVTLFSKYRDASANQTIRRLLRDVEDEGAQLYRFVEAKKLGADGFILQSQGNETKAFEVLQKAFYLNPRDADVLMLFVPFLLERGLRFLESGNFEAAFTEFEKITAISPDNFVAYNNMGSILYGVGRYRDAQAMFERAIALNSRYGEAHFKLGESLLNMGQLQGAQVAYQKALDLDPTSSRIHNSLGVTFERMKDLPAAREEYTRALSLDPENTHARVNRGNTYLAEEDYQTAISHYMEVLKTDPDHDQAYYNLGAAYFMMDEWQKARDAWTRVVELVPSHSQARAGLELIESKEKERSE
jgi:spermidine synthase